MSMSTPHCPLPSLFLIILQPSFSLDALMLLLLLLLLLLPSSLLFCPLSLFSLPPFSLALFGYFIRPSQLTLATHSPVSSLSVSVSDSSLTLSRLFLPWTPKNKQKSIKTHRPLMSSTSCRWIPLPHVYKRPIVTHATQSPCFFAAVFCSC